MLTAKIPFQTRKTAPPSVKNRIFPIEAGPNSFPAIFLNYYQPVKNSIFGISTPKYSNFHIENRSTLRRLSEL